MTIQRLQSHWGFTTMPFGRGLAPSMLHRHGGHAEAVARIAGGPYRIVPHPNYVAVIAEGFALPLVHSAWITALAFTVLNAALLRTRIKVENAALASLS